MLIPSFRRSRAPRVPAGSRTARFQSVLIAALDAPSLREQMVEAQLGTPEDVRTVQSPEEILQRMKPSERRHYGAPAPASRGVRVPYSEARAGLRTNARNEDLYSLASQGEATADLVRLGQALWQPDAVASESEAIVVFSGIDSGLLSDAQRDELWALYGLPVFEQFVDLSGHVVASECEVHDGLHVRVADAIIESIEGELVLTSLVDLETPVLRMRTGITGIIETACCECGCPEPRLTQLGHLRFERASVGLQGVFA